MRARLKSLDSPDLPLDPATGRLIGLEDYEPPDPRSFRLRIDAEIGPDEGEGADIFYFMVCAPDPAVSVGRGPEGALWQGRVLFLREWSYERLLKHVSEVVSQVEGADWPAVAGQLSANMEWEFEATG